MKESKMIQNKRSNILITGFEPFGAIEKNSSQTLIEELSKESLKNEFESMGFDIKAFVLPVEYEKSFETLKALIDEYNPALVLSFGVAQKRKEICFERIAVNYRSKTLKDNSGCAPTFDKVLNNGPDGVFSNLMRIDDLSEDLKEQGWKVKVSLSAGDYVCNALMYETCLYAKEKGFVYDFIHIPNEQLYFKLNQNGDQSLACFVLDLLRCLTDLE